VKFKRYEKLDTNPNCIFDTSIVYRDQRISKDFLKELENQQRLYNKMKNKENITYCELDGLTEASKKTLDDMLNREIQKHAEIIFKAALNSARNKKKEKKMDDYELEDVKNALERLKKIEESTEEKMKHHFRNAEEQMYQAAKFYVDAYEARDKAAKFKEHTQDILDSVKEEIGEEEDED